MNWVLKFARVLEWFDVGKALGLTVSKAVGVYGYYQWAVYKEGRALAALAVAR